MIVERKIYGFFLSTFNPQLSTLNFLLYTFHPYGVEGFAGMIDPIKCHSCEGRNPVLARS